MAKAVTLLTGAGGEMGRVLAPRLRDAGHDVVAMDLNPLPQATRDCCIETAEGDVLDATLMRPLLERHRPTQVFHLAAVLSAKAERNPHLAHRVNVNGTLQLIQWLIELSTNAAPTRFLFPSSIAVYGLPDAATKRAAGALEETDWARPTGAYGCQKLYCEMMGSFFSKPGPNLAPPTLDFRSIRFPGLISAESLPHGGTTDFAPEMIHAAVRNEPYTCFVAADTALPFMTMPDAINALLGLAEAEAERLSTRAYNIQGFAATAGELRAEVLRHRPQASIDFDPGPSRQALADSWPAALDDSRARNDWGLNPRHGLSEAVGHYLLPALERLYGTSETTES